MQLSDLTAQFVGLANRRDLTANTSLQTTFINQAVMRIQRELRVPAMEKSVLVTMGGIGSLTVAGVAYPISSAAYDPATGAVTLVCAYTSGGQVPNFSAGASGIVAGISGAGSVGVLNGTFTAGSDTTGGTFTYTIATNLVIIVAPASITIPNDLLELQRITPQTGRADQEGLVKSDPNKVQRASMAPGVPELYARVGAVWNIGPTPAANSVMRIDYWAELQPLILPTDTNIISVIAWDLIVYAALVQMAIYYKDVRKDDFEAQYQTIFGDLQEQSDVDDLNGSSVVELAYEFPLDQEFLNY